jgi:hypothetical protein
MKPRVKFKAEFVYELLDVAILADLSAAQLKSILQSGKTIAAIRRHYACVASMQERAAQQIAVH